MIKINSRRLAAWILCAALLLGSMPGTAAAAFPFTGYMTENQLLRESSSASSTGLVTVPAGASIIVSGIDGSYYIAQYEGKLGYILQRAVSLTPAASPSAAPLAATQAQLLKYPALSLGSEGPAVRALQQGLQELNFHKGTIDGKYGKATESSVSAYQEKNKLPVNGIADAVSQERLFEGTPLNAAGKATDVRTLPAIAGQILRPGDRGDLIWDLQQKLKDKGYYKGTVDGVFGNGTEDAVRAFQRAAKLNVDGKAGNDTMQALAGTSSLPETPPPAFPEPTQMPPFQESLGEATYPYQTIATASVNLRKSAATSATRILTIPTGASITVLETKDEFLKVTYGKYTGWAMSDYISVPEQYLSGKSLPIDSLARQNYETLGIGSNGDKVRALQQALTELGYYKSTVDGVFAAGTLSAMKAFQEKNSLRATGVASPEIQQLIYEKRPRNAGGKLVYLKLLPPIPGFPMQQGDVGDAVMQLNRGLIDLGHYTGTPTSEYTLKTSNAVKAFQKAHSIKQTGKTDAFTLLAINTALGIVTQPTPQPGSPEVTAPPSYVTLKKGTKGVAVTQLQTRLVSLGYDQTAPDGDFGSKTEAAVKAFQMRNNLLVNGIADYATQQALYSLTAIPAGASAGLPSPGPLQEVLRIGSVGAQVVTLQTRLVSLNYLKGKADGIFGTQTAQALTAFQRKNSLKADGVAGSATLNALYGSNAQGNQGAVTDPSKEEDSETQNASLRIGDSGSGVRSMQQRLIELKYLTGGADGIFGPGTFLALQAFQTKNKLQSDGIAGKLTLAKLSDPKAIAATGFNDPKPTVPGTPSFPAFTAPRASEVRLGDLDTEVRSRLRSMPNVIIYDFMTGAHYNVTVFSLGKHADGEPPTKQDTQIMEKALGYNNWTPRPVWVIFSDGRVYMASTHSHGHEVDHNSNNGLTGHICIHFPRPMEAAEAVGPYAVSHQQSILKGWDLTQSMAK